MATNKKTRDTIAIVAVLVALVITVMANLLADRKFARLDLTSEKKYSLSPPFLRILDKLDDTATLTYYISGHVPSWFEVTKRDILDKLREIETAAKGKIMLEAVDPTENKELAEALAKEGFQHQVQDIRKDAFTAQVLFTGIKIAYKDKKKVDLPAIGQAEQLEYLLGSKILEMTMGKKPTIAVDVPPAPPQQQQNPMMQRQQQGSGYEWLQYGQWEGAKEKFEVKSVNLTEKNNIPSDASLLILVRPKALDERQRYEVVKYLAGGGRVLLIAAPFKLTKESFQGWRAERTPTGLEDYLKESGLSFGNGIVADHSHVQMISNINLFTGEAEMAHLPFYVKVLPENLDHESVLTRFMPALMMPIPAEIDLDADQLGKNGIKPQILAKTSRQSWTVPFTDTIDPDRFVKYDPDKQVYTGSKNVFVVLEGQFPFPYEGKPIPEWKAESPEDMDKDKEKEKEKDKEKKAPEIAKVEKKPGILVVCSAPEAFHSMYMSQRGQMAQNFQANAAIIVNMAETFSLGTDLVQLRSKSYETRSINKLEGEDTKRTITKVSLVFAMPVLVMLFALTRTLWRRRTQVRYERQFAQTTGPSSFTADK